MDQIGPHWNSFRVTFIPDAAEEADRRRGKARTAGLQVTNAFYDANEGAKVRTNRPETTIFRSILTPVIHRSLWAQNMALGPIAMALGARLTPFWR